MLIFRPMLIFSWSMSVEKSSSKYQGLIRLRQLKVILLVPCINMTTTTISHSLTIDYFLGKLEFSDHLRKRIRKVIVIVIRKWVHFLKHCLHWHHHLQKNKIKNKKLIVKSHLQQRLVWWLFQSFGILTWYIF